MNGFVTFKAESAALSLAPADDADLILGVLASLPFRTRTVLLLHRFDRLNCAEIGRRLRMPAAAVEAELAAGLEALIA